MWNKVVAGSLAAIGLVLLSGPAQASPPDEVPTGTQVRQGSGWARITEKIGPAVVGREEWQRDQSSPVTFGGDSDVLAGMNVCDAEIPIVTLLSSNDTGIGCATSDSS